MLVIKESSKFESLSIRNRNFDGKQNNGDRFYADKEDEEKVHVPVLSFV